MKKFRGFTLIESLAVIGIIGIITAALFNMRNVGKDYTDYRKEAVNIIYKEIEQYLREFQRNKVRKDPQGNEHEIDTFQMIFTDKIGENTRSSLEIGNTYTYCLKAGDEIAECLLSADGTIAEGIYNGSGHFESEKIISGGKFELKKNIKNIDDYKYYISASNSGINIGKHGEIYGGNNIEQHRTTIFYILNEAQAYSIESLGPDGGATCRNKYESCLNSESITEADKRYIAQQNNGGVIGGILCFFGWCNGTQIDENTYLQNKIKKCLWENFDEICGDYINELSTVTLEYSIGEGEDADITSTSLIISAKKDNSECKNVGKITINAVAKSVSLDRCNNDREQNGIDCGTAYCKN